MNLAELFDKFSSNVYPAMLETLANSLNVTADSLIKLGIGFWPEKQSWIFAERDETGKIIGLIQRCQDNKKFMVSEKDSGRKSKRGLTYALNPDYKSGSKKYVAGKQNWIRVTENLLCPICGKPDWCLVSSDNPTSPSAVLCSRISEGSIKEIPDCGFLHLYNEQRPAGDSDQTFFYRNAYPILVVEGQTDVLAALDMGFAAVGRPSAKGKIDLLVNLLRGQNVIIVGENDAGAGKDGMESAFAALGDVCKSVVKILPPETVKDLRDWKTKLNLTKETLLKYAEEVGVAETNPDIFEDNVAHTIAKKWLKDKQQDGMPLIRNYKGQWVRFKDDCYSDIEVDSLRGELYSYVEGKSYYDYDTNGVKVVRAYKPSRAKISDIVDALNHWCPITENPPVWLDSKDRPNIRNLITFKNGILDVNDYIQGKVTLANPTPALFTYNMLPYNFDEDLSSKMWDKFTAQIFDKDEERIKLLAEWFGYNLVPDMSYEKFMLFTGRPRSGKSSVMDTMRSMLGEIQCCSVSFQALCGPFGYQPLMGKLAALLGDAKMPRKQECDAALEKILNITGGDVVSVNRKGIKELPNISLKCRFTITMNDLPMFSDHARALEPRLNVLHFGNSYEGREDRSLKIRLKEEARKGKLANFALVGLKRLYEQKQFTLPESSRLLIKQFRELNSPVISFVMECCNLDASDDEFITKDQAYEVWQKWCLTQGRSPGMKPQFGRWLIAACPQIKASRMQVGNKRKSVYLGVRFHKWVSEELI